MNQTDYNQKYTVLHVDDDRGFLDLFPLMFRKWLDVTSVDSIRKALKTLKTETFDVIIIDHELPEMSGIQLLQLLVREYPDTPVILFTGQGNEEVAREAFITGACDYFIKEVNSFAYKDRMMHSIRNAIERKRAEKAIRENETWFRLLFEEAPLSYQSMDSEGRILDVNKTWLSMMQYEKEEIIGRKFTDFLSPESREVFQNDYPAFMRQQETQIIELDLMRRDKGIINASFEGRAFFGEGSSFRHTHFIFRDITRRKQAEIDRELSVKILDRLNQSDSPEEMIRDILTILKRYTACESLGLQVMEEPNFPYYSVEGSPEIFNKSDDHPCCSEILEHNQPETEKSHKSVCLCTRVLQGKVDPSLPFFTTKGSFWTNSTSDLLSRLNIRKNTENTTKCIASRYESIALIPLQSPAGVIGLLQISDNKRGCFNEERIHFLEGISACIGIALSRCRHED